MVLSFIRIICVSGCLTQLIFGICDSSSIKVFTHSFIVKVSVLGCNVNIQCSLTAVLNLLKLHYDWTFVYKCKCVYLCVYLLYKNTMSGKGKQDFFYIFLIVVITGGQVVLEGVLCYFGDFHTQICTQFKCSVHFLRPKI